MDAKNSAVCKGMDAPVGLIDQQSGQHSISLFSQHRSKTSLLAEHSILPATDSGYDSIIRNYGTPNVSSDLSTVTTPPRTASNLITIAECTDAIKLTPVTQNIQKITEFHITTPKSNDFRLRGIKRSSTSDLCFQDNQSTPKKFRRQSEVIGSPAAVKCFGVTPNHLKRARSGKKFRQRLKSAPDVQYRYDENDVENVFTPYRGKVTPKAKRTPLSSTNTNIQTSILKSSVHKHQPPTSIYGTKPTSVKKILSFNDKQFEELLNTDPDLKSAKSFRKTPKRSSTVTQGTNSDAWAQWSGSGDEGQTVKTSFVQPSAAIISVFQDRETAKLQINNPEYKTTLIDPSFSRHVLLKGFNDENNVEIATKSGSQEDDMEISLNKYKNDVNSPVIQDLRCSNLRNFSVKSSFDVQLNESIEVDGQVRTPTRQGTSQLEGPPWSCAQSLVLDKFPRTPKKAKPYSVDQERLDILYPTIPATPSKKTLHRTKSKEVKEVNTCRRKFYGGSTHLNVLQKLEPYTVVVEKILDLLSSQDLLNVTRVSKGWRRVVRQTNKANARLKMYLEEWKLSKENNGEIKKIQGSVTKQENCLESCKKTEKFGRLPFAESNKNDRKRALDIPKSPPVSPSKRKFHENQKVVRTLCENEKLVKCPRCLKSSRIIHGQHLLDGGDSTFARPPFSETFRTTLSTFNSLSSHLSRNYNSDNNNDCIATSQPMMPTYPPFMNRGRFLKSMSLDSALPYTPGIANRRPSVPSGPFGLCSGFSCQFRFCMDCNCEYHPGVPCKLSQPASPTKEDLQNGIIQVNSVPPSRSLKNRRKFLKRLCF